MEIELKRLTKEEVKQNPLGIVGNVYCCGYWLKAYKVLDIHKESAFGEVVTCEWEDGRITTNCTNLDIESDRLINIINGNWENYKNHKLNKEEV